MEVNIDRQDGGVVALTIHADAERLEKAVARVYRDYSKRIAVPGFRKGKVPQRIMEQYIPREQAEEQAIENLANEGYRQAVDEHDLTPMGRATLGDTDRRDDGSVVINATVSVRPEVTLGDYKGLKATKAVPEVTDDHVDAEIDKLRSRHAEFRTVEDRGVEQGDLAIVDCTLMIDGQPNEAGSASGYPLEVGADQLFPELNESLIGAQAGEERRVPVTYPDDFHREELAGKSGEFVVAVRQIRRRALPELTDEFVTQHTSAAGADDLRGRIRGALEAVAEAVAESQLRNDLVNQVIQSSQLDPSAELVEREAERRAHAVRDEIEERGESLEGYLARRGLTEQAWRRSLEVEARADVRRALVLDALGRAEGLEPSEAEVGAEVARLAEEADRTPEHMQRRLEREDELDRIANRVYHHKIMDFLVQHAEVTTETVAAPEEAPPEEPPGAEPQPASDSHD